MNSSLQSFFLFLTVVQCYNKFIRENAVIEESDGSELNGIIRHCSEDYNFYKQLVIINENGEVGTEFYRNIHQTLRIPIEIFDDLAEGLRFIDWRSCVIICIQVKNIGEFLDSVDRYSWKPSNIYAVYSSEKKSEISIEEIYAASVGLWGRYKVHKFVVSINGSNLYFDPFQPSNSRDSFGVIKDIGNSTELLKGRETFGGYEARVLLFDYVTVEKINGTYIGLDASALTSICEQLKLTPKIFDPPEKFGWRTDNGTFTGTLGRLIDQEGDLSFNGFFIKDYQSNDLEFTGYVSTDQICVIVPPPPQVPDFLLIVRIFGIYSWAMIFVGNSFVAFIYTGMMTLGFKGATEARKVSKLKKFVENSPPCGSGPKSARTLTRVQRFLGTWTFFCFYPMKGNATCYGERLHVAFGLILGVIVSGYFTSKLASSFSKPAFVKNIDSLRELDASGLEVLTNFPNLLVDVFADNETSAIRNLRMKLKLANITEITRKVSQLRTGCFLDRRQNQILRSDAFKGLHIVDECPKGYLLAYPIPKGSPFLCRINTIIGRLHNGGFYKKWLIDLMPRRDNDFDEKPVVIRLDHLYMPFSILFAGLTISAGIFACEFKRSTRRTLSFRKIAVNIIKKDKDYP